MKEGVSMMRSVLGDLWFDTGWKTDITIVLFGQIYHITVKVRSYTEADGLTDAQQKALSDYKEHSQERGKEAESLLCAYDRDSSVRFLPRTLLFERDGGYALLCDDREDPDDGIAVILSPKQQIMSQDDYL